MTTTSERQAGMFLNRQLEMVLPKLYPKKYPQLWGQEGMYLPAIGNLEIGSETVIEETFTELGEAAIYADLTSDVPTAEAVINEFGFKAVVVVSMIKYSVLQLEKARKSGRPLKNAKVSAALRAIRERINRIAIFGSQKHEMQGIFNSRNIPTEISTYDATTATTDDHIDFVADNIIAVEDDSNLVEGIRTIMVPPKLHNIWSKARIDATNESVLTYLLKNWGPENGGTLEMIRKTNECRQDQLVLNGVDGAGVNQDLVFFSAVDPESLERRFFPTNNLAPQLKGMCYENYFYAGTSEMIDHYPLGNREVRIPTIA